MTLEPMWRREVLKRCGIAALAFAAPAVGASAARARTALPESEGARDRIARATIAQDIARWLEEMRYEELPANVVARAKRVILDTLGCALGALDAEPVRLARRVGALQGGNREAAGSCGGGKG